MLFMNPAVTILRHPCCKDPERHLRRHDFSDIKVAITGGTGRFEGASGVAVVRGTKNPLNDIDVLRLVLPR